MRSELSCSSPPPRAAAPYSAGTTTAELALRLPPASPAVGCGCCAAAAAAAAARLRGASTRSCDACHCVSSVHRSSDSAM